jgi:transcriptional regulator with XRE-family HTH domain
MAESSAEERIGERIRALRTARKWSQRYLANLIGVSPNAVFQVESGKTGVPQPANLQGYAEALEVSVNWLLTGSDEPPEGYSEWPPPEVYLRQNSELTEEDIEQVVKHLESLKTMRRLQREIREAEERGRDGARG